MLFYPKEGLIRLDQPDEKDEHLLMAIALAAAECATVQAGRHRLAVRSIHPVEVVDAIFIGPNDGLEVRLPVFAGVPLGLVVTPVPEVPRAYEIAAGFDLEAIAPVLGDILEDYAAWSAHHDEIVVCD